jgi:hypothetical protein
MHSDNSTIRPDITNAPDENDAPLKRLDLALLAKAIRAVTVAITEAHTADCLIYAHVGAAVLRALGVEQARAVAGSALWRIGSGDGDVIAHALELQGSKTYAVDLAGPSLAMHAWIELPKGQILDFTTWTLRDKAKALDALDGGHTMVEWAPDYLLAAAASAVSIKEVTMAPAAGVFSYIRHPQVEAAIQAAMPTPEDVLRQANAVLFAYNRLQRGGDINVIGVREDGSLQTEPPQCQVVELP